MALAAESAVGCLPIATVNPRQVRDLARAVVRLAKTDAIDALVLAHFTQAVRPPVGPTGRCPGAGNAGGDGVAAATGGDGDGEEQPSAQTTSA